MRILITGCGGMLGAAVYAELKDKYTIYATDIDLNEEWLSYLDVRSFEDLDRYFKMLEVDAVIHLAALTDNEYCELNALHAYDVNFIGAYNIVRLARQYNIPVVYISSGGIFGGTKLNYTEEDIPNPLNVYAKSKYAGELAITSYPKSIVIRAGWMMGGGPLKDKKFVNKLIKQIREGNKNIYAVKDKIGTPTYTYELAKIIHYLLANKMYGIFHGVCSGSGSRADIAQEIILYLGLTDKVSLNVVDSKHFNKEYFAARPYSEKLENTKLEKGLDWKICLKDYINRFEWKLT